MKSLKAEALIILGITALPRTMGCWKGCPVWITKVSFSSEQENQLFGTPENTNIHSTQSPCRRTPWREFNLSLHLAALKTTQVPTGLGTERSPCCFIL